MSLARYYLVTVWDDGFKVATNLGLIPDKNSFPALHEWYFTFDTEKDSIAFQAFLCPSTDPSNWIPHAVSIWINDPRS